MLILIAGLVVFFAAHIVPTNPALRSKLVNAIGALPYKAGMAIVSLIGFYLIVIGKGQAPFIDVWTPPTFLRHLTLLLVLLAFIILPATYIASNIKNKLKHPMLVAVKLWALGHLLANGDLASMLLFGSFLAYAIFDRISVKKRGELPTVVKQPIWKDLVVVVIGFAAYMIIMMNHMHLFGVPVITVSGS